MITFGTHVPAGYDFGRDSGEQPEGVDDYAEDGTSMLEEWGKPNVVVRALELHNEAVVRAASTEPGVTLLDLAPLLSAGGGAFFVDVCHFSEKGCDAFVEAVAPAARTLIEPGQ